MITRSVPTINGRLCAVLSLTGAHERVASILTDDPDCRRVFETMTRSRLTFTDPA